MHPQGLTGHRRFCPRTQSRTAKCPRDCGAALESDLGQVCLRERTYHPTIHQIAWILFLLASQVSCHSCHFFFFVVFTVFFAHLSCHLSCHLVVTGIWCALAPWKPPSEGLPGPETPQKASTGQKPLRRPPRARNPSEGLPGPKSPQKTSPCTQRRLGDNSSDNSNV